MSQYNQWFAGEDFATKLNLHSPGDDEGVSMGQYFRPWYNWRSEKSHPLGRWKFLGRAGDGRGNSRRSTSICRMVLFAPAALRTDWQGLDDFNERHRQREDLQRDRD